ncbi:MAG: TldD/PmbA family protein [Myxococcaceae bacterium]
MSSPAAFAKQLLQRAKKRGATQAEAYVETGRESSVRVRDGEIEDLTQSTSKGVGLRVIVNKRLGFAYTSDFTTEGLDAFVDRAVALAKAAAAHAHHVLPTKAELAKGREALTGLFDPAVASLAPDWKVKTALEIEKAAKAEDARITAFDSVGAGDAVSEVFIASSEGLNDTYSGTYAFLYAVPVASDGQQLQTSYWVDYKRFLSKLDSPEQIGREAARRAVRMLGARKVSSAQVPVIFDPLMASGFVGQLAQAASGDLVYKKSTVLAPLLGKRIAPNFFNLVDDGRLPGGIASAPFDGEGTPTRKTYIVQNGRLQTFLYDAFTARNAKKHTTGNASRGYSSLPSIGTHNLYLEPGDTSPQSLIGGVKQGLYVTAMLGRGMNPVTGEYSRGANGLWIENGELAYPVQEVTVAGNLLRMLERIDGVGNDLVMRGSTGAPTLRFSELTVSGG